MYIHTYNYIYACLPDLRLLGRSPSLHAAGASRTVEGWTARAAPLGSWRRGPCSNSNSNRNININSNNSNTNISSSNNNK